jgi:hypothetical protein
MLWHNAPHMRRSQAQRHNTQESTPSAEPLPARLAADRRARDSKPPRGVPIARQTFRTVDQLPIEPIEAHGPDHPGTQAPDRGLELANFDLTNVGQSEHVNELFMRVCEGSRGQPQ